MSQLARARGKRSFDVIGDIAILDASSISQGKKRAREILSQNHHVKTVFMKKGGHTGKYRLQKLSWLAGEHRSETIHKEWGLEYKLDVQSCYFSPRSSTERMRISNLVRAGEHVLVMFSGVGPFALAIAKHTNACSVTGIELNPACHGYAQENAGRNKLAVRFILGSANIAPALGVCFDRVIMPLPASSTRYLRSAIASIGKSGVLHIYVFCREGFFEKKAARVLTLCERFKKNCRILAIARGSQAAPRTYRICIDIQIGS